MEGIRKSYEAGHVVDVVVRGVDWADEALVQRLNTGLTAAERTRLATTAVRTHAVTLGLGADEVAEVFAEVEEVTGPGGWPTLILRGPIHPIDELLDVYWAGEFSPRWDAPSETEDERPPTQDEAYFDADWKNKRDREERLIAELDAR